MSETPRIETQQIALLPELAAAIEAANRYHAERLKVLSAETGISIEDLEGLDRYIQQRLEDRILGVADPRQQP